MKFEVTLKRTYFYTVIVDVDEKSCDDPWRQAKKQANSLSWDIDDAESCEDDVEGIDTVDE